MKDILFISKKTPEEISKKLGRIFDVRLLEPSLLLGKPVCCHADMLVASIGGELIVCSYYLEANKELFGGVAVTAVDEKHGEKYPLDVLLNCFELDGAVYGRKKSASGYIIRQAKSFVNVNQGYAHCSALIAGGCAVTSDEGIYGALTKNGADALLIRPGYIALPGYDHGFIGGASFAYRRTVYFFGSLASHPDGETIKEFIASRGYGIEELSTRPLLDLGGAAVYEIEN